MAAEENFVASKKRRRSSLFVDRRSQIDDSHGAANAANENKNVEEIQNYISNTKQCYRNWRIYEREMETKLKAARNAKPLQFDEKTLMEFLSEEDRSFLKEAEGFLERRSELTKELSSATTHLKALVEQYEFNKELCDLTHENLSKLHQATVAKAVNDHQEMTEQKFGRLLVSSEFPISYDAPQILDDASDSE